LTSTTQRAGYLVESVPLVSFGIPERSVRFSDDDETLAVVHAECDVREDVLGRVVA
jgi:hypothetical protein